MLEFKKAYGANVIQVLMVIARALNGYLKSTSKKTFHSFKAYSLHFSSIIIYQES